MSIGSLEKLRAVFNDTQARNIKILPFPATIENLPIVIPGQTLVELHPEFLRPLPQHHRDLLHSDATLNAPDYTLILTTDSAYRFQLIAKSLVAQLNKIRPIGNRLAWEIQTALHELLTNAITHGNLNASNLMRHNRDNLTALGQMMLLRLKEPEYAARYLTITLKLTPKEAIWHIADEGAGFDTALILDRIADDPLRYSGRGIIMAQKLSSYLQFESGGRIVTVAFSV